MKNKWKPKKTKNYYIPDLTDDRLYYCYMWLDEPIDELFFDRNLVCKTKEEAIAKAKAIIQLLSLSRFTEEGL